MSEEDITQGTRYFNALKDVANAARKLEAARVRYDDTVDQLNREMREAEEEFRAALERAVELTGEVLPVSNRQREAQRMKALVAGLEKKGSQ